MKNVVFWDVALCRSCVNRRFGGMYRLHLQGRKIRKRRTSAGRWLQPPDSTGGMERSDILGKSYMNKGKVHTVCVSVSTVEATGYVIISMASLTMRGDGMCAFYESYSFMFCVISRQFYEFL
jgi:hypothetical protein